MGGLRSTLNMNYFDDDDDDDDGELDDYVDHISWSASRKYCRHRAKWAGSCKVPHHASPQPPLSHPLTAVVGIGLRHHEGTASKLDVRLISV